LQITCLLDQFLDFLLARLELLLKLRVAKHFFGVDEAYFELYGLCGS